MKYQFEKGKLNDFSNGACRYIFGCLFILSIFSCFHMRKPRDLIESPSGDYTLKIDFNENKDDEKKYQCIILTLLDKHNHQVTAFQTGASSYQKWAVGWYPNSDTIVLNSGDIGILAYHLINNNQLEAVNVSGNLDSFAYSIFELKYSNH